MKLNNIKNSPISTIAGILIAGLVAVQQTATSGHVTWQMSALIFAIAALGALAADGDSLGLGMIQKLVVKHGAEAVQKALQDELEQERKAQAAASTHA